MIRKLYAKKIARLYFIFCRKDTIFCRYRQEMAAIYYSPNGSNCRVMTEV